MHSIYLYDTALRLVKAIEKTGQLKIHTLATQGHYYTDQKLIKEANPFLKETCFLLNTFEEHLPDEPIDISYETIEQFRPTQLKVLQYMERTNLSQYQAHYIYYRLLSYFYKIFKNGDITGVLTVLPLHGHPLEMIPIDLALQMNIPVYTLDVLYANTDGYYLWGFWNYQRNEYVNINGLNNEFNLNNYLFYKTKRDHNVQGKKLYQTSLSRLSKTQKIKLTLNTIIFNNFDSQSKNKRAVINSLMAQYPGLGFLYLYLTNKTIRSNYLYHKKTKKFHDRLSCTVDFSEKYIYYPLHLDPEASTLVREKLSNQLTIIKILSDSIPDDWKIYVKEHPVTFSFLKRKKLRENWYFFLSMNNYRGRPFYEEILRIPKTRLISQRYTSEEVLKDSMAVATINGTVCLEAAHIQKPVLIFGEKLVAKYVDGMFNIRSAIDCKNAISDIDKGFKPHYNLQVMQKYLFEMYLKVEIKRSEMFDMDSPTVTMLSKILRKLFV